MDIAPECSIGETFVTGLVVDPEDHRRVWAGVEIDGVYRSLDGGDTWTHQKAHHASQRGGPVSRSLRLDRKPGSKAESSTPSRSAGTT